jgi:hypothetical protein
MATSTPPAPTRALTDQQFAELLPLLRGVDSTELKLTVPASAHRATIQGLPIDPVEAQPRQVYFFDTPDLALNAAGLVVRARRIQGGRGDTVVKLRPVVPSDLPAETRRNASFNVEVDVLPGGFVCSGSFKGRSTGEEIKEAVTGSVPLHRIFSKEQRAFYELHAPAGIALDRLVPLGPTFILKSVFTLDDDPIAAQDITRMVAEVWLYPDGSMILELSLKCPPREAIRVGVIARTYLATHGVPLGGEQQTKTKTALEFYRDALARQAATAATTDSVEAVS